MALDLNEVLVYKEFYGKNTEQMPLLIAEGRIPISVAGIMERRLNSKKHDWKQYYFFTGDAIVYHPDKKFKIVLDAEPLRNLSTKSNLENGALILPDGIYENMEGEEFSYKNLQKLFEEDLSQEKILQHPIWKAVARDQSLLEEYVPKMFAEMNERWNYKENMGFHLDYCDNAPKLKGLVVYGLEGGSYADGRISLDFGDGRLVGVAPEAPNLKK